MCYTLLDTIGSAKNKQNFFLPLPILVTQICKEWMLEDEFNHAIKDKISIKAETISSSYNASAQIDWVPSMLLGTNKDSKMNFRFVQVLMALSMLQDYWR